MNATRLRSLLLAGVSMATLVLATPAAAAVTPGVEHDVVGPNADDLLIISLTGDPQAVHGDVEHGTAAATAILNFGGGQIVQVGFGSGTGIDFGNADLAIRNDGSALLVASAIASDAGGSAKSLVFDMQDIIQIGDALADATALIENAGGLEARAAAAANGSTAQAEVHFSSAISQQAGGDRADAGITNSGSLQIGGSAVASATAAAAAASLGMNGIHQAASGVGSASAHFTNTNRFSVGGAARANGATNAFAIASVSDGVLQSASGPQSGSLKVDNAGLISIEAVATAAADGSAHAGAAVDAGLVQLGGSVGHDDLVIHNSGMYQVDGIASADGGESGIAVATALADWFVQSAFAQSQTISFSSASGVHLSSRNVPTGSASALVSNGGEMTLIASGDAHGRSAFVVAGATGGTQNAIGSQAFASIVNSGKMDLLAVARASAAQLAGAEAFASGLHQLASAHSSNFMATSLSGAGHAMSNNRAAGAAAASFANSGTIDIVAEAHAVSTGAGGSGTSGLIGAAATAVVPVAISQAAVGTSAHVSLDNHGIIHIAGTATAAGPHNVAAQANENGIGQAALASGVSATVTFSPSSFATSFHRFFEGPARVELTNSGTIDVGGVINASAGNFGRIDAHAAGVQQIARGSAASASLVNDDSIAVAGSGHVHGLSETGFVFDSGIHQRALGSATAVADISNQGSIKVLSRDSGTAVAGVATNIAIASGIAQSATAATPAGSSAFAFGTATASLENSGAISVESDAKAQGGSVALGVAFAAAVRQAPIFGTLDAKLDNDGAISALANASAAAAAGPAFGTARATGYFVEAANVVADVVNKGSIDALANVHAAGSGGSAFAFAVGVSVNALSLGTPAAFGNLSGLITNNGMIEVEAKADSAGSGTVGAVATGIFLSAPVGINATLTNTGSIDVTAISAHNDDAQAWGIHVFDFAPEVPGDGTDILTINNSGRIVARQSSDGGDTFRRGLAIDVTGAPGATVVNLLGGGTIFGDIALRAGDIVNTKDGATFFDGVINPSFLPPGGVTAAGIDSGLMLVGMLNIEDAGDLILADPRITGDVSMFDGPSYAFVDTLNVASDGMLTFQLQPESGGLQAAGTYSQIFADTANLGGTLVADITTPNGLFADNYTWQNVIDANIRNAQFSQCELGGALANSLLLKLSCSYDSNANVDLELSRTPFSAVGGLNANALGVANGLDSFFNVNLTGGPANLFRDLFLFNSPVKFDIALNMLSGSVYANYLNSFPSVGVHQDDLIDRSTNCDVQALAGSVLDCRSSSPIRIWAQLDYQHRRANGDSEAGKSVSTRFTGLLGMDAKIGNSAILGVAAGRLTNHVRDEQFEDEAKGDGWTLGAYADLDPGAFFIKGLTTYSSLDGDSTRHVDFERLTPGATFIANPTGSPDVRMWTAGLHAGARVPMGTSSVITPYLNLDFVHASLDGFSENDGKGAELTIERSKSSHSFFTGGIKWAGRLAGMAPEIDLGYRYRLGDQRSTAGAFFTPDPDNKFDIMSSAQKRGELLAGLSVGGKLGPVEMRLAYEGGFNGDVMSHSGNFTFALPLGGRSAPPPPQSAPPRPAPPASNSCRDGSAIAATASCPLSPGPPPPPAAERRR